MRFIFSLLLLVLGGCMSTAKAPSNAPGAHQAFFDNLSGHCGKAYEGTMSVDTPNLNTFANKRLVMHVAKCSDTRIEIPFFVGEDASRTWIIQHHGSHLSLHHRHNHKDGTPDTLTQYGGHALTAGWPQVQSFPADQDTIRLFVQQQIPQSMDNTWQLYLYPTRFSYRLIRQAREVRVDFDLTRPIKTSLSPW